MAWKAFNFFEYDPEKVDYQTTKFNIKQALNNNWAHIKDLLTEMRTAIDDKVKKETGKGLSTNDFDNTYKTKVDNAQEKPESEEMTLAASAWDEETKSYSFEESYPNTQYDIVIELDGGAATEAQTEAWDSANIKGNYPENILYAKGDVPAVDIPVIRQVIKK